MFETREREFLLEIWLTSTIILVELTNIKDEIRFLIEEQEYL